MEEKDPTTIDSQAEEQAETQSEKQAQEQTTPLQVESDTAEAKNEEQDKEEDERAEFLAAMEQEFEAHESNRGEMISGTVISLTKEYAFVDLGGKSEGILSLEEYRDETPPKVGDEIEACVISTGASGIVLSRKLAKGIRDREFLQEAYSNKLPVEGRVEERNKGGFTVVVAGLRAFCPISQIELHYCEEPDVHLGQKYSFLITKYDDSGRRPDLVLSRKALLQAEAEREAAELRKTLREGDIVAGTVRSIRDFGAFIDLGGLDGLLPISEISHSRVEKVSDVLKEGEEVHVQVLSFDKGKDRISLSLKRLESDPWDDVMASFPEGIHVIGKVVRLQPFGAFVELAPGVDGLIHISNLNTPERVKHPKDILKLGDEVEVQVLNVDPQQRRIGLARVPKDGEFGDIPVVGAVLDGVVDSVANFGVFVRLGPGRKGLVPNNELGTTKGADNRKEFKQGDTMKVKVLEITDGGKRIRLSRKAAIDDDERADFESYLDSDSSKSSGGFGTFGDLLKSKLGK